MAAGYEACCLPCVLGQPVQRLCLTVSAPGCEFDGAAVELCPTTAQLCERLEWAGSNRPPGPVGGEDCYVTAVVGCGIGEGEVDGTWGLAWAVGAFAFSEDPVSVSVTCDPLQIVFDYGTISAPGSCCSEATTTVTVTVTACGTGPWCGEASAHVWNPTTGVCDPAGGGGGGALTAASAADFDPAAPENRPPSVRQAAARIVADVRQAVRRVRLPCAHLGERLPGTSCGNAVYRCRHFGDRTRKAGKCAESDRGCGGCPAYAPAG